MDPYQELANAIIVRAAEDYRKALKKLKTNSDYGPALRMKAECEWFFRSGWFGVLTTLDGTQLMEALKKEAA